MKKTIYFLLAIFVFSGCLKDRTLTDYKDVIRPELADHANDLEENPEWLVMGAEYRKANGEVLKLVPDITYEGDDELSYRWTMNKKDITAENISGDPKILEWPVNLNGDAIGALYVTRVNAGNSEVFYFNVKLDNPYERGWLLATDDQGVVHYDFLQEIFNKPYREHFSILQTETPSSEWVDCVEFWSHEAVSKRMKGHMLHLTSNPAASFSVNELSMIQASSLSDEFYGGTFPEGVSGFKAAAYGNYVSYLLGDNGKLYGRKAGDGYYTGKYMTFPVRFEDEDLLVSDLIPSPYNLGFIFVHDSKNDRFLSISNGYTVHREDAGTVAKIPVDEKYPDEINSFKGEDIVYARIIMQTMDQQVPFKLFMVTRNRVSGKYSASEFNIHMTRRRDKILAMETVYTGSDLPGFGENSKILVVEQFFYDLPAVLYYTDNANPGKLKFAKRTATGITDIKDYHTFESNIVSLDHGVIRTTGNMGVALEDGTVYILNISKKCQETFKDPEDPKNSETHSGQYKWKVAGRKILKLDFRYGTSGNYFL